jgi:uncharacterized protein (UPF0371 family)
MPLRTGFNNEKYLAEQTTAINDRVVRFGNKLYLEFGGKLLFDYHAARVLPGFDPNVKMRLLQKTPTPGDEAGLRKLGVNLTSDPDFSTKCLFGR